MTDRDRGTAAALTRKLTDLGVASPDAAAAEILAIVRGHGYRQVILPPPPHEPGRGLPTPGSTGAALVAAYRERAGQEDHDG